MKNRIAIPFPFDAECAAFDKCYNEAVAKHADDLRSEWMPAENIQRYKHGIQWQAHNASDPDQVSTMDEHSFEFKIRHQDIVEGKYSILPELLHKTAVAITESFRKSLYDKISQTCEASGQTIDGRDRPLAESFLDALRSVEFGVDKDGNPSLPQFHLHPKAFEALVSEVGKRGPEFRAEIEKIKLEKIADATIRENERLSKFNRVPNL